MRPTRKAAARIFSLSGASVGQRGSGSTKRCTTKDDENFALRPDIHVTRETPPTFLLQAENDNIDGVNQSLAYYISLKNAGAPVEMHLYAQGGHAFGLRRANFPVTGFWPV